jgi:hypothetical protein
MKETYSAFKMKKVLDFFFGFKNCFKPHEGIRAAARERCC